MMGLLNRLLQELANNEFIILNAVPKTKTDNDFEL